MDRFLRMAIRAAPPRSFDAQRSYMVTGHSHSTGNFKNLLGCELMGAGFEERALNNFHGKSSWNESTTDSRRILVRGGLKPVTGDNSVFSKYAYHAALNLDVIGRDHYRSHF